MTQNSTLDRRTLLALATGAAIAPRIASAQSVALRPNLPGPYDLVINNGRAMVLGVFTKSSSTPPADRDRVIAETGRSLYDHFARS
jgi:hypothetical protein